VVEVSVEREVRYIWTELLRIYLSSCDRGIPLSLARKLILWDLSVMPWQAGN